VPEEGPADAGSAECGINDEKLDEVPAEEVSWLGDDEAGHGSVSDVDLALSEHQAAPQELSPFGVALSCNVIGAQNAVQVIGNCAADPSRRLRHWLSLACRCCWFSPAGLGARVNVQGPQRVSARANDVEALKARRRPGWPGGRCCRLGKWGGWGTWPG
jgi:hypothetical protein